MGFIDMSLSHSLRYQLRIMLMEELKQKAAYGLIILTAFSFYESKTNDILLEIITILVS